MDIDKAVAEIKRLHEEAQSAHQVYIDRSIEIGKLLLGLQQEVGAKGWGDWVRENLFTPAHANRYMRLAAYEKVVRKAEPTSMRDALDLVVGLPKRPRAADYPEALKTQARSLYKKGHTANAISQALGVSYTAARCWVDPAARQKYTDSIRAHTQKRNAEKRELREAQVRLRREKAVKALGGNASKAYQSIRKACVDIDAAIASTRKPEVKSALQKARIKFIEGEKLLLDALAEERTAT